MSLRESFELSLKTLGRNRLRSALTLLGIAIGVGAVLAMVAVGDGARSAIEEQVTAAGLNVITVTAGNYKMKVSDPGDVGADHASLWEDTDAADPLASPTRNRPSSIPTNTSTTFVSRCTPKTIRWKSTTIQPRGSGSAIRRPAWAPPRR